MTKSRKISRRKNKNTNDKMPMVAFVLLIGSVFLGYLVSEITLYTRPHLIHWVTAVLIAFVGYLIGLVIYRRYGDIL